MTASDYRIGLWSARILVLLAVTYIVTGAIGMLAAHSSTQRVDLQQVDPFLAILEIIMVVLAPVEVTLFAAVYAYASEDRKTCGLIALIFVSILAALTCSVHFVLLTLGRQTGYTATPGDFYPWPTVLFALDLLAWDVFQGLGLLFAAPVFRGKGLSKAIRLTMIISGALCLIGTAGPATGDLRLQIPAIFGYAGGLAVVCVLLAIFFARPRAVIVA